MNIEFNDKYSEDKFWYYVDKIKEINEKYYKDTGRKRKYFLRTYGCPLVAVRQIL